MGIYINGMEMPKSCIECPMQFGGMCYVQPAEIDEPRVADTPSDVKGRADWCPLIEVPDDNATEKHGKWVLIGHMGGLIILECSACHKRSYYQYNFCPECGAEMDGKDIYVLGKKEDGA